MFSFSWLTKYSRLRQLLIIYLCFHSHYFERRSYFEYSQFILLSLQIHHCCVYSERNVLSTSRRTHLHTPWGLHLCFSRLTLDSSVDIACFSMKVYYKCSPINADQPVPETLNIFNVSLQRAIVFQPNEKKKKKKKRPEFQLRNFPKKARVMTEYQKFCLWFWEVKSANICSSF